ncbi:hypothetical protein MMC10_004631 [Thelotrema lepadinum]|nr:hypothetical protein [Thelotrema lepadinum]
MIANPNSHPELKITNPKTLSDAAIDFWLKEVERQQTFNLVIELAKFAITRQPEGCLHGPVTSTHIIGRLIQILGDRRIAEVGVPTRYFKHLNNIIKMARCPIRVSQLDCSGFARFLLIGGNEDKKAFWNPAFLLVYGKSIEKVVAEERKRNSLLWDAVDGRF